MFKHVDIYPGDTILSLVEQFHADPRSDKINLSIGVYFDENGCLPLPVAVANEQKNIAIEARSYLPMEGHAGLRSQVADLLFGATSDLVQEKRLAVVQTLGGSGALKLGADFIKNWFAGVQAHISNPTWDNHRGIFEGAGIEVGTYPYYDAENGGIAFEDLCAYLEKLPENDVVLLHPCCHNPTGVDLSMEQWDIVLEIIKKHRLIPFMDMAYQGFGDGFDEDAYAVRRAAALGLPLFVSCSFSKNMSLYSERMGALSVVCPSEDEALRVLGQLKFGVRRIYSSPPSHGALVVAAVLEDSEKRAAWQAEVYQMRDRIKAMRQALYAALTAKLPERDFSYFIKQKGMFSYTGLSLQQVLRLREEFGIYLLDSGRMCVAGLNEGNVATVAAALAVVFADKEA